MNIPRMLSRLFATTACCFFFGCAGTVGRNIEPSKLPFADLKGHTYSLSQLKARAVVVHYWATWCATCVAEIHKFDTLAPRLKKEGIEFLLIAVNDSKESLLEFQHMGRTHLPFFVDVKEAHQTALDIRGLPVTVLLTRTGDLIPFEDPEYHNQVTKLHGSREWIMPGIEQIFARAVDKYEVAIEHQR